MRRIEDMDYSVGIARKHFLLGVDEGRTEGRAEGRTEGRAEGQSELANAIHRLKSGETMEQLIASGVDDKTANLAKSCL